MEAVADPGALRAHAASGLRLRCRCATQKAQAEQGDRRGSRTPERRRENYDRTCRTFGLWELSREMIRIRWWWSDVPDLTTSVSGAEAEAGGPHAAIAALKAARQQRMRISLVRPTGWLPRRVMWTPTAGSSVLDPKKLLGAKWDAPPLFLTFSAAAGWLRIWIS